MAETESRAPAEALFTLDLGANGGVFAPTTLDEARNWLTDEQQAWTWIRNTAPGSYRDVALLYLQNLDSAIQMISEAQQYWENNEPHAKTRLDSAQTTVRTVYSTGFPHRTSARGIRVRAMYERHPSEALGYLFALLVQDRRAFDGNEIEAWKGFFEGLSERFHLAAIPQEAINAALGSFEELRGKIERQVGVKNKALGDAQRRFEGLSAAIEQRETQQADSFTALIKKVEDEHAKALKQHNEKMEQLQDTFRKAMALRAPVKYWEAQRRLHAAKSKDLTYGIAGAVVVFLFVMWFVVYWALGNVAADANPPVWKAGLVGLAGVMGFWIVRLVVRVYLSHRHLANDAAERVTMVQTYLALHEEDKVPADEDRKLVMGSLFRTASDGFVKDDAAINPILEAITKTK